MTGQADFRTLPAWRQARHLALAIVAVTDGFRQTDLSRQWARKIEQAYLTMLLNIVAAFERRGSAHEAQKSIDRIETVLRQAQKKKLLGRPDLLRLTRELDSVRSLFRDQDPAGVISNSNSPLNSQTYIPIPLGVSYD
ncbi:MAG: hypothetical protein WEB33_02630 [Bacteroidota bacterium]